MELHERNLPGGIMNGMHPVGGAFLKLAEAIEKLPASPDQTAAHIARDDCSRAVVSFVKGLQDELKALHTAEGIFRVSEEIGDLQVKLSRLQDFIYNSGEYNKLSEYEQNLLKVQSDVMPMYLNVLRLRLEEMKKKGT